MSVSGIKIFMRSRMLSRSSYWPVHFMYMPGPSESSWLRLSAPHDGLCFIHVAADVAPGLEIDVDVSDEHPRLVAQHGRPLDDPNVGQLAERHMVGARVSAAARRERDQDSAQARRGSSESLPCT